MRFNSHSELRDRHADLSPSNYHWMNYDEERMAEVYTNRKAARRGTELHEFAKNAIRLGVKLPNTSQTLNMYVNDAIGYRMVPEQILMYSYYAFGTADTIGFGPYSLDPDRQILRIHDLKTGVSKASEKQLEGYAALFCLEYKIKPRDIEYDLRIYQNDSIEMFDTDPDEILRIMSQIKDHSALLERMDSDF